MSRNPNLNGRLSNLTLQELIKKDDGDHSLRRIVLQSVGDCCTCCDYRGSTRGVWYTLRIVQSGLKIAKDLVVKTLTIIVHLLLGIERRLDVGIEAEPVEKPASTRQIIIVRSIMEYEFVALEMAGNEADGTISIDYVKSEWNLADPLTKPLGRQMIFETSRGMRLKPLANKQVMHTLDEITYMSVEWGRLHEIRRSAIAGTSPLGQNLKIIERSRVKETSSQDPGKASNLISPSVRKRESHVIKVSPFGPTKYQPKYFGAHRGTGGIPLKATRNQDKRSVSTLPLRINRKFQQNGSYTTISHRLYVIFHQQEGLKQLHLDQSSPDNHPRTEWSYLFGRAYRSMRNVHNCSVFNGLTGIQPFSFTGTQPFDFTKIQPFGFTGTRPSGLTVIRPFGLEGTRLFGLPGIQPVGLATIRPHRFCLLGSSPGTPGSRTTNHVYWEVLQELLGHGRSILSTGKFSRNSWVTDNQSRLLGGSPGTPGPRTINFVYWKVLQELLGHGQPITSTGRFSRNSWVTDGQFGLLGSSPGTLGSRTTNHVYWEVLQELLGHGRSITSTWSFSRNSWVTDGQSRLLGGYPGTPGPRTINFELLGHGQPIMFTRRFSKNSWATDGQFGLLGSSPGTPRPRTTNLITVLVYWEILLELLGHRQPFMPTWRYLPPRSKLEDHRTIKGEGKQAVKIQEKQAIRSIQAYGQSGSGWRTTDKISNLLWNVTMVSEEVDWNRVILVTVPVPPLWRQRAKVETLSMVSQPSVTSMSCVLKVLSLSRVMMIRGLGLFFNMMNLSRGVLETLLNQAKGGYVLRYVFSHLGINACILVEYAGLNPFDGMRSDGIQELVMSVVQEKSGIFGGTVLWKMPTRVVNEGEDICDGAIREVKEGTWDILNEMNIRRESEVGIDDDGEDILPTEVGLRRVEPRNTFTSAFKCSKQPGSFISYSRDTESIEDGDVDRNGDECRLCGMDGILLCCDECPSAYHSRCIAVLKNHIPKGPWYCPGEAR
ncbi:hypothetical protein V8G54_011279 [Vigna mungo]|uniref:Zinc finger PHD-type domain-containing protein n=1 Tax=Vigna mungo TaxID=3915 RepID=A0AAQ3S258_VIGMU